MMIEFFPSREIALSLGSMSIHWYGIMYLLAFFTAYLLLPLIQHKRAIDLSDDDWAQMLSWAVIGVIVGGRLGYVAFYAPQYFLDNPTEIVKVWHGGMASHGGFVGVIVALSIVCWRRGIPLREFADIVVIPASIGLAFGRMGNFINQELYGTVTDLPWAMAFSGAEGLRHPLQLYAVAKDLAVAAVCYWHLHYLPVRPGRTFALFLLLYGTLRFCLEFIREQEYAFTELLGITLSRGQLLTLPLIALGLLLWFVLPRSGGQV